MHRKLILGVVAIIVSAVTAIIFLPAAILTPIIENQFKEHVALADVHGSIWEGSAVLASSDKNNEIIPYVAGKFVWHISPMLLLGSVDIRIENSQTLTQPVQIKGNWHQLYVDKSGLLLDAEQLRLLGAPFNTLRLTGDMQLSWNKLLINLESQEILINGKIQFNFKKIASALSPVKPLGAYQMQLECLGDRAAVKLLTLAGPLQLNGAGTIQHGRLQFSGEARADQGQENKLAILLNLLGQSHRRGNINFIALDFK